MKTLLLFLLAASTGCLAATTIEVSAKFADIPPGVVAPNKPESLATTKGINVYSAPRRQWAFDPLFYTSPPPGTLTLVSYNKQRWFLE